MPAVTGSGTAKMCQGLADTPYRFFCSSDSGYGSIESSPTKILTPESSRDESPPRPIDVYDGSGSPHASIDEGDENESIPTPTRRAKSLTFPRTPNKKRLPRQRITPGGGFRPRRASDTSDTGRRSSTLVTPDRFVPIRDRTTPSSEKYRTSKAVEELTPGERLLRCERDAPDPFYAPRQPAPPSSSAVQNSRRPSGTATVLGPFDQNGDIVRNERQSSFGAVWNIGGLAPSIAAVDDGHGRLIRSGTNAPIFPTSFHADQPTDEADHAKHEARLALALDIDRAKRILDFDQFSSSVRNRSRRDDGARLKQRKTYWNGVEWAKDMQPTDKEASKTRKDIRTLPIAPFKVLDAPNLRDDYYCSVLAYSESCDTLAVALGNTLYSWTEQSSVQTLNKGPDDGSWLTSIAFSSNVGNKAILAYGRSNGSLSLMSLHDSPALFDIQWPRFRHTVPAPVACLSWRPTVALRRSFDPWNPAVLVENEDLLVGDETGNIYYFAVEWPTAEQVLHSRSDPIRTSRRNWRGKINHIITINVHTQQICGLSWSPNGKTFASGGNDNLCCLFEVETVLPRDEQEERPDPYRLPSPPSSPSLNPLDDSENTFGPHHDSDRYSLLSAGLLFASAEDMAGSATLEAEAEPRYMQRQTLDDMEGYHDEPADPRTWWNRRGVEPDFLERLPGAREAPFDDDDFPPYLDHDDRFWGDYYDERHRTPQVNAVSEELAYTIRTVWNHARIRTDGSEKHRWMHTAAVKAIAFCPWRDGLVATGGGSNDKCIHFYHTTSGAALATIAVHAQVTSLIWSTTRREIAATFGYANPEHPYRIAIFSWPECQQVAAIP